MKNILKFLLILILPIWFVAKLLTKIDYTWILLYCILYIPFILFIDNIISNHEHVIMTHLILILSIYSTLLMYYVCKPAVQKRKELLEEYKYEEFKKIK